MNKTAYFHPAFAEELSLLSPDTRIEFYTHLLRDMDFSSMGHYTHYNPGDPKPAYDRRHIFWQLGNAPKAIVAFDNKRDPDSRYFVHLKLENPSLSKEEFDTALLETCYARTEEMKRSKIKPVSLNDFSYNGANEDEYIAAIEISNIEKQRKFYRRMLMLAHEDTQKEAMGIFNLSAPQMERFMTRLDYYLQSFDRNLGQRMGGTLHLDISYKGTYESYRARTFKELTANEPRLSDGD